MLRTPVGLAVFGIVVGGTICAVYAFVSELYKAITKACDVVGHTR